MSTVILRLNESDPTVTMHATRLKDGNPGAQLITVTGGLNALGQMNIGDVLFIIGHGSPTAFGGYSATSLAKLLATNDLHSGISIDLVGCQVGATGAPYALDLKLQLVANKIVPTSVTGGTNNMQVKADGTPFTKTPGPGGTEILPGKQTVNTPWGPRTRNINPKYGTS